MLQSELVCTQVVGLLLPGVLVPRNTESCPLHLLQLIHLLLVCDRSKLFGHNRLSILHAWRCKLILPIHWVWSTNIRLCESSVLIPNWCPRWLQIVHSIVNLLLSFDLCSPNISISWLYNGSLRLSIHGGHVRCLLRGSGLVSGLGWLLLIWFV